MAQQFGYGQPPYAGQPPYPGQPAYQQQGYYQGNQYQQSAPPPGFNPQVFMPPPSMRPGVDAYVESGDIKSDFGFNSASVRAAFIRKVFILVGIMLTVVTLMTAIPFLHQGTMTFVQSTPSLYFLSYFVFLVVYLTLMCCESVRRSFPGNLVALSILTLAIGYMTMMICSYNQIISVLLCLIITAVCCGGIIIFRRRRNMTLQVASSKEFVTLNRIRNMYGIMFIISLVLLIFGIVAVVAAVAFHVTWLYTIYAGFAALVFMVYLAIDIQTIMGGRKYEISPEDYIFAAIQVFMDIVYIFWMLLSLFGSNK
ncbi:Protein lifeguard 2 [Dirofilaria immitis]|nr:Protein lifeguard 2 [Dirofilaria immitis]